ncbi:MAG: 5'-methylthioadenosine/adenosylhomocysteine nucleosidase, partial [Cytophagales bacterium]|nr:5'-methylthioadenosine/adenosylhomocysteine nucleosidase [Cytophagales bacterium]
HLKKTAFLSVFFLLYISGIVSAQRVAIVGAMPVEVEAFRKAMNVTKKTERMGFLFYEGTINQTPVVLVRCGIGKVNAAMTAALLMEHYQPECLLFSGIAGGVGEKLHAGDLVLGAQVFHHDMGTLKDSGFEHWGVPNPRTGKDNPVLFHADRKLLQLAENTAKSFSFESMSDRGKTRKPAVVSGCIATGDAFVASEDKNKILKKTFQTIAVDMESASVAQVCFQHGVPFLIIRSISDGANEDTESAYYENKKRSARNASRFVLELVKSVGKK